MPHRDMIVLGGSAGAIDGLRDVVSRLPARLPATVFIAVHLTPYAHSYLPQIFNRLGPLPASEPVDRERTLPGHIYVAPPDHHLLVGDGFVRVVQGPKEHGTRPALDPLFRTAAVTYGPRVIGGILSGYLDDGTLGLSAVKSCGGLAIAQDPAEALCPDMPRNVLDHVEIDYCLPVAAIAEKLVELVHQDLKELKPGAASKELHYEAAIATWDEAALQAPRPGQPSSFVCPECRGDLWELREGKELHFRCRTGHAYSHLTLAANLADGLDETLNEAFHALIEKAHLEQRLARRTRERGSSPASVYHERLAQNAERCAGIIREMLLSFQKRPEAKTPLTPQPSSQIAP